ncbi:MAG: hypothetical protein LBP59_20605 [Planctomycetaceae bacterium]|jgi:hypothetical protein|nr:hypothetical protein [Planctomycetaceae bacterium]
MGDIVVGQELLLGYLMNVLDDAEIQEVERELATQPKLRRELAKLQKNISSLDVLLDAVDPPPDLTQRTCDKIWTTTQNENFSQTQNEIFVQDQNDKFLQDQNDKFSRNLRIFPTPDNNTSTSTSTTSTTKTTTDNLTKNSNGNLNNNLVTAQVRRTRRRSQEHLREKQPVTSKNMLRQIMISAVVGILLAIIIYPATGYLTDRITQLVVRQKVRQLDDNVDIYAQLSDPHLRTALEEIDLTRYSWQELVLSSDPISIPSDNSQFIVTKIQDDEKPPSFTANYIPANSVNQTLLNNKTTAKSTNGIELRDYLFLGQSPVLDQSLVSLSNETITGETNRRIYNFIDENNLIINLSQPILVSEGSKIKTATGQSILIQNDKIFFRIPPQPNTQNK